MKEIEVGEYVRTKDGGIYKVVDIDNIFIYVDKEVKYIEDTNTSIDYIKKSSVVKHSKNLIDLIEVGDIVNEKYVSEIKEYKDGKTIIALIGIIMEDDIKSILTKERYQANCYTVERRENGD